MRGDSGSASPSLCGGVGDIATDSHGALYISDEASDALWKLTPERGLARLPIYLSNVRSLDMEMVASGVDGDLYVGRWLEDEERYVVQRVSLAEPVGPVPAADPSSAWDDRPAGTFALVAGTGEAGYAGDGGPATGAMLNLPGSIAAGPSGTLYVVDTLRNGRIRAVGAGGTIETVAGNGELADPAPPPHRAGPAPGDGQLAIEVPLGTDVRPTNGADGGVAAGPDGSVYVCDEDSHRVYRVSPLRVITTFAGTGEQAYSGDGGLAVDAALAEPVDVAVSPDGGVYVADHGNDRIRRVGPDGTITTVAEVEHPVAVDVAPDGTVYAVAGGRIWRVDPSGATPSIAPYADEVTDPGDIAVGPDGLLYASSGSRVLAVRADGTIEVVAGSGGEGDRVIGPEEQATEADLPLIDAIAIDRSGNLYLSHAVANQVTVVVRVTEEPRRFPWHWVVLAVVGVVALGSAALSYRAHRLG
jgi:streptogramin lyase